MNKYIFATLLISCLSLSSRAQTSLTLNMTGHDANCNGSTTGSAKAVLSGGVPPYSYFWGPGGYTTDSISGLAIGTYSVTATDNAGNIAWSSVTISQPDPLTVWIDSIVVPPCFRTTSTGTCGCSNTLWAVVSGGTPPYSYLWTPSDSTTDTLFFACYLDFTVTVTDHNNCISSDSLNVVIPPNAAGVAEVANERNVMIYPNPATNLLNISIDQSVVNIHSLEVYNMLGGKVLTQQLNTNTTTLDVSGLIDGNYLLRVVSDGGESTGHFSILR